MNQVEGTFTFVFTDIEGSTALLRALGRDYGRILAEHDAILKRAAEAHGGRAFGSEGDAQFLVFGDVDNAIAACAQAQRELGAHAWPEEHPVRVRMGIHSGTATPRGAGFVGLALHETARLSSAGHGGQVLVSAAARELARHELPDDVRLVERGEHRLKDFDEPLRIYQLVIEGLESTFPPLRTMAIAQVRLPTQLTDFVGRAEVEAVSRILASARVLTLTGPGGTGKTRLSIQVASEVAADFPQGTYFVALDAVTDAHLVASEIAVTLGLVGGAESPLERLVTFLADKVVLLVLDNLEQVLDAAPDLARLVRECAGLRLLVTSRIPMGIYGEHEFPVPALGLPPPEVDAETVGSFEAARLFISRAEAARPGFVLDDAGASTVAEIVRRLDGLPLAIELAAARLRVLPLDALRQRLDDSLSILTGGGRDRPGRQQTLRGAIEWSHDLLDQPDRRLFARLGVNTGSAALAQLEDICGPTEELGRPVFEGLESLSRQSLVRVADDGGTEPRFGMLATIREFARERLAQGDEQEALRRRHAMAYLALAETAAPQLIGLEGRAWNERLETDHDDLRAALDWIVKADDAELGLRMIAALWRFWQVRGHLLEGEERVAAVLALPSVARQAPGLISRGEGAAGSIAYWRLDRRASHDHYAAALEHAKAADDQALLAESLYNMGFAVGLNTVGLARYTEGAPYFEEALAAYRSLGDRAGEASALWALHQAAEAVGDLDASQRLARQTLEIARELNDPFRRGWAAFTLALSELRSHGRVAAAAGLYSESLEVFVEAQDSAGILFNVASIAEVALQSGDDDQGWRLVGAAARLKEQSGARLLEEDFGLGAAGVRQAPETVDETRLFQLGQAMSREETIQLARRTAADLMAAD